VGRAVDSEPPTPWLAAVDGASHTGCASPSSSRRRITTTCGAVPLLAPGTPPKFVIAPLSAAMRWMNWSPYSPQATLRCGVERRRPLRRRRAPCWCTSAPVEEPTCLGTATVGRAMAPAPPCWERIARVRTTADCGRRSLRPRGRDRGRAAVLLALDPAAPCSCLDPACACDRASDDDAPCGCCCDLAVVERKASPEPAPVYTRRRAFLGLWCPDARVSRSWLRRCSHDALSRGAPPVEVRDMALAAGA